LPAAKAPFGATIDTFRFDDAGRIAQMRAYFGPANIERTPRP
jgi:hypothetical protein